MKGLCLRALLSLGCFYLFAMTANAQSSCPGCLIDLPNTLSEDTVYLAPIPAGEKGVYYDEDISFRLPKTTDPVAADDPDVPSGLTISEITIDRIANLPPGLSWEVNQSTFKPEDETDGCIKICGTPFISGNFTIDVVLSAQVVVFNREVSLSLNMDVLPNSTTNEGFSITNSTGCGETTASFVNNIQSEGREGYSYFWDFGNGITSIDENPQDQMYTEPGVYIVKYRAIVDTTGYILTNIELTSSSCDDTFSKPDIVLEVKNPQDSIIYTSNEFKNTDPPIDVNVNIKLLDGLYQLKGVDKDDGLEFDDDECVTTTFNQLSNGVLEGDDYEAALVIVNPIDTIEVTDTIIVYELPLAPTASANGPTVFCQGDSVELTSIADGFVQWYFNDSLVLGATEPTFMVYEAGNYTVELTSEEGCQLVSDGIEVVVNALPDEPRFSAFNNELIIDSTVVLPDMYTLQWYYEGDSLPGETGTSICATASGTYNLIVIDLETQCQRRYAKSIQIDPDFDCTVSADELVFSQLKLFPNPTNDFVTIQLADYANSEVHVRLFDALGRQMMEQQSPQGSEQIQMDLSAMQSGVYFLMLRMEEAQSVMRVIKR